MWASLRDLVLLTTLSVFKSPTKQSPQMPGVA